MPKRIYTRAEIAADAVVHAVGLAFAAIGAPAVIALAALRADGGAAVIAAVAVYAATLVAMFAFSAGYNLIQTPRWREVLRRLDHGTIYLKIAGAYTPFAAVPLATGSGPMLLLGVWTVAGIGFFVKLAAPRRFELASVFAYLALGWSFILVAREASAALSPEALTLLATGGGLYTVGVAFHLWDRLPFQNAIWHLHVLVATACIYAAVIVEVVA